jgi:hypothetical protein
MPGSWNGDLSYNRLGQVAPPTAAQCPVGGQAPLGRRHAAGLRRAGEGASSGVAQAASAGPGRRPVCHVPDQANATRFVYQALVVSAAIDPPGEAQDALQAAEGRAVASERERRPSGRPGRAGNGCRQS